MARRTIVPPPLLAALAVALIAALLGVAAGDAAPSGTAASAAQLPTWTLSPRPRLSIGGADADGPAAFFGGMWATRLSDGRVVVGDGGSREIRIFAPDGRHLRTVGGKGGGPGEFGFLSWVGRFAGDSILAYDESQRRLSAFGPTGEFAGAVTLAPPDARRFPTAVGAFRDGRVVARLGFDRVFGRGERRDTVPFLVFARDGSRADTIATLPGTERFFLHHDGAASQWTVGFGRDAFGAVAGDLAVLGSSDAYAVALYDSRGRLLQRLQAEHAPARPPAADVARWRESLLVPADAYPGAAARNRLVGEVPHRPTYPAFADLAVSTAGDYWLRAYPRDGDLEAAGRWVVYDRTGQPRARVTVPARFTLLEVGDDYVLGRWRDGSDVSHLQLYELRRPR